MRSERFMVDCGKFFYVESNLMFIVIIILIIELGSGFVSLCDDFHGDVEFGNIYLGKPSARDLGLARWSKCSTDNNRIQR